MRTIVKTIDPIVERKFQRDHKLNKKRNLTRSMMVKSKRSLDYKRNHRQTYSIDTLHPLAMIETVLCPISPIVETDDFRNTKKYLEAIIMG